MKKIALVKSKSQHVKLVAGVAMALALSACSSTESTHTGQVIDTACVDRASNMAAHAETSRSAAQMRSSANALQHCIANPLPPSLNDEDTQAVMQVMAISALTYMKAGELDAAAAQMQRFETHFPGQDLYLPDYTSFRDTVTALIGGSHLSTQELASLNISRELRREIERQQYWLTH